MMIDKFNLSASQKNSILSYSRSNKFPQTMLVEGKDYETRLEFAKLIANMIVCQGYEKPCGICSACVKCASGNHPDIKFYGNEDISATFKVDTSREIKADAYVIPNDGDKKVFIIAESQNMNDASENALLKILEEPPSFDYFILTCQSKSAMLDTILSRATLINIGEGESSFSQEAVDLACETALALLKDSEIYLLEKLAVLVANKGLFRDTIGCLTAIFTDSLVYKQTEINTSEYSQVVEEVSLKLTAAKIYALTGAVKELAAAFEMNANYNLLITDMSGRLRQAAGK